MSRDRNYHFSEGAGNPIVGYSTDEAGTVCRDCAKNDPELADIDPRTVYPIHFDDLGRSSYHSLHAEPDGFTCTSCGEVIGAWDFDGGA